MKQLFLSTLLAVGLAAGAASAATLDFVSYANTSGEHGVMSGTTINFNGVDVTFDAGKYYPYFDSSSPAEVAMGGAGLGVCKRLLASTGLCYPSSDDNVTEKEAVRLTFGKTLTTLEGLLFNAEGHHSLAGSTATLLFGINGGALSSYTFSELMGLSFHNVDSATFAFGGTAADQFYVGGATIPVPAAAPLLLGALGMLGFGASRRRKS